MSDTTKSYFDSTKIVIKQKFDNVKGLCTYLCKGFLRIFSAKTFPCSLLFLFLVKSVSVFCTALAYVPTQGNFITATNASQTISDITVAVKDIAVSPDGTHAYFLCIGESDVFIDVIDTATNRVSNPPIFLPDGTYTSIVITPDGKFAYVSEISGNHFVKIDLTLQNTITIPIASTSIEKSSNIAITPDGDRLYFCSDDQSVYFLDTTNDKVSTPISIGLQLLSLAITPDGEHAYVTTHGFPGEVFVIDTNTNTVEPGSIVVGNDPVLIEITSDGAYAYVTNIADSNISVIDIASNRIIETIDFSGEFEEIPSYGLATTPIPSSLLCTLNLIGSNLNATIPFRSNDSVNPVCISPEGAEMELSCESIEQHASDGEYIAMIDNQQTWKAMSVFEYYPRLVFSYCIPSLGMDSPKKAAERRSWEFCIQLEKLPEKIRSALQDLTIRALDTNDHFFHFIYEIHKLFSKTLTEAFVIQQHPLWARAFRVDLDHSSEFLFLSSKWGVIDVFNPLGEHISRNTEFVLFSSDTEELQAGIQEDFNSLSHGRKVLTLYQAHRPSLTAFTIRQDYLCFSNNNKIHSLAFKEGKSWKVLQVSELCDRDTWINIAWAILKFEQHYSFPSPTEPGGQYVSKIPQDWRK